MSKPAKKSPRAATKAPAITLHLRTHDDFRAAVDTVATAQLELLRLQAARDKELAAIHAIHGPDIEAQEAKIKLHLEAAATYAENFTAEVLPDKDRVSYETTLATYGLRLDPPSIEQAPKVKVAETIALLEAEIALLQAELEILEQIPAASRDASDRERIESRATRLAKLRQALRQTTVLNKEHLHTFTKEELAPFGLRKTQGKQFWIKGKEETATRDKTTTPAA